MSKSIGNHLKLISKFYYKNSNFCLMGFELNNNLTRCKQMCYSIGFRSFNTKSKSFQKQKLKSNALSETQSTPQSELTIGEKVKQTTQDISYFGHKFYLLLDLF